MARYDFYCPECCCLEEVTMPMADDQQDVICLLGHVMRKVFRAPGVIFRGSGWASKS